MAISGHKTLTEVQRYTAAADKKRIAYSGAAKMRGADREQQLHKHGFPITQTGH